MASTPPAQIHYEATTPTTPRHRPSYHTNDTPRRSSTRLRQKRVADSLPGTDEEKAHATLTARTPRSPRQITGLAPPSPGRTPRAKHTQKAHVLSPSSPGEAPIEKRQPTTKSSRLQPFLSSTTTLSEGMLPTPVKTPRKKQVANASLAARALFEDPAPVAEIMPSPRKSRKPKRYNGFSLESFRVAADGDQEGIQIFTDSRDQIPKDDRTRDNPFAIDSSRKVSASHRVPGSSKRRKVSTIKPMDPQVDEAIKDDEGMVYVFRGKKVFRRFDDGGEEEEEIDASDLGLLAHASGAKGSPKSLKTLTRKSIRPTRLFQTAEQKRARELRKEEEAVTDIEENLKPGNPASPESQSLSPSTRKSSRSSKTHHDSTFHSISPEIPAQGPASAKRSPFDSWKVQKSASAPKLATASRGRKREAAPGVDTAAAGSVA